MAQPKAIFLGRDSPDTGLDAYRRLARRCRIRLDVFTDVPDAAKYIPKYDFAFVSRYLAILEALSAGVPVFAHYNNAIKYDYLVQTPFAKFITIFSDPGTVSLGVDSRLTATGKAWAGRQTWAELADIYEKLWRK